MNERAIILALILMPLVGGRFGCGEGAYAEDYDEHEISSPAPPELRDLLGEDPSATLGD